MTGALGIVFRSSAINSVVTGPVRLAGSATAAVIVAIVLAGNFGSPAQAAPEKAVCAVEQAIACAPYEPCERNLPASVNLPSLLKIDRSAGVLISRREAGEERISKIGSESGNDATHVLQGVDEGTPWSMLIDLATGRFTLASARGDAGYVAFGLCSSRILD